MKAGYYAIALAVAFLMIISFAFLSYGRDDLQPYSCISRFEQHSAAVSDPLSMVHTDATVTLFLTGKQNGFFSMAGTVATGNKVYHLNRRAHFIIAPKAIHGMKMITIHSVITHPIDNLPEDLWNAAVSPEVPGIEFYVGIKKINDNTVLINSLLWPYLVCVIQYG
ncbi:hypothetical protein ACQKDS_02470 [Serratia sp. NPDC078593]|uniref:hypothetical protein n=1 Tax=unclassified Serratia (in: enterobacteria) TaxID=2647522 RepID=UPI0037CF23C5